MALTLNKADAEELERLKKDYPGFSRIGETKLVQGVIACGSKIKTLIALCNLPPTKDEEARG